MRNRRLTKSSLNPIAHSLDDIMYIYTNIDCIRNKADDLSIYITSEKPHIIAINETKLKPSELTGDFFIFKDYVAYSPQSFAILVQM